MMYAEHIHLTPPNCSQIPPTCFPPKFMSPFYFYNLLSLVGVAHMCTCVGCPLHRGQVNKLWPARVAFLGKFSSTVIRAS